MTDLFEKALHFQQAGRLDQAIQYYSQLLKENRTADVYANMGVALRIQGHMEAALTAYRLALQLDPQHVAALSNLGGGLRAMGQLDQARAILQQAITLQPDFTAAHYNLGLIEMDDQRPEKAIACFDQVLRQDPKRVDAQFDRATCLLQLGNLQAGFAAYECRFGYEAKLVKPYPQPKWEGSPLKGQTLLLYAEQGFGDTLQFCRYIPLIEKEGGRILLECPPELKRLMETVDGVDQVLVPGDKLPAFERHASLLSLPHLFGTTIETIPTHIPYLHAPNTPIQLKPRSGTQIKVGLVWASGHPDIGVRNRSIPLEAWGPVLENADCSFYALQKGEATQQLYRLGFEALIEDLSPRIHDFSDTATFIQELDILITADTAIVHLAGALRKPCWVLLPYGSEWRWLLQQEQSPWYPSVRLFHRQKNETWEMLSSRVQTALQEFVTRRAHYGAK